MMNEQAREREREIDAGPDELANLESEFVDRVGAEGRDHNTRLAGSSLSPSYGEFGLGMRLLPPLYKF